MPLTKPIARKATGPGESERMSYDLMVFDPALAPREREAFLAWHDRQTECAGSFDPVEATAPLRAWFFDMIARFPAMNGPYAPDTHDPDNPCITDYSVGSAIIYAAFGWSQVDAAYEAVFRLAAKHRLGFFDVSSEEGGVWLPDHEGQLVVAHANRRADT